MSEQWRAQRMRTGVPGLDHLLEGGLVRGNSLLVEGAPGSGKTTVAIRMIYEGIVRFDEPGLIITFEEFPKQIYEEALGYGVDLNALEKAGKLRVVWTPPARILEGFAGKNDLIEKIIDELGVRRIAIDSITHFKRVSTDEATLRELLAGILNYLKLKRINAFLVKELERIDDATIAFEEYLVDASLRVHNHAGLGGGENVRYLEIRKTRGQGHVSGRHPFLLGSHGLHVYPHLRPQDVRRYFPPREEGPAAQRVPTGVPGLDEMLHGGLWSGSLNLVSGFPGTGKSVLAYHFLEDGLSAGENALLVSIGSTPEEIFAGARSLGLDGDGARQDGRLKILEFPAVGIVPEVMLNRMLYEMKQSRPSRLVFDTLDDLRAVIKDSDTLRDFILVLSEMLRAAGTTSILLEESNSMGGPTADGGMDNSSLASCVIQLSMAESEGHLRRFVGIRKHAGSDHAKDRREIEISAAGLRTDAQATALTGVLSGHAQSSTISVADEVLPPLGEIAEILKALAEGAEIEGDARSRLNEARSKLGIVDIALNEHLGRTRFHEFVDEWNADGEPWHLMKR